MSIYIVVSIFVIFCSLISIDKKYFKELQILCFFYLFLIAFYLAGFRYKTGTDYNNYFTIFVTRKPQEIGYNIFSCFFKNFYVFLVVFSFVSLLIKFSLIKKITEKYLCLVLLWFLNYFNPMDMGAIRNSFALGICLWAAYELMRDNVVLYFILILLASSFHSTAIICLVYFFIFKIKRLQNTYILFVLLVVSYIIGKTNIIFTLLEKILNALGFTSFLVEKLIIYMTLGKESFSPSLISNIPMILIFTVGKKYVKNELKNKYNFMYSLMMIGYSLSFIFMSVPDIAIRIPCFFDIYKFVMISFLISGSMKSYYLFFLFIGLGVLKYFSHINAWYKYFVPFRSILSL